MTMRRSGVDGLVRGTDPVTGADVASWTGSGRPEDIFRSVVATDPSVVTLGARTRGGDRRRSRPRRVLAVAFAVVLLTAGTAAARALLFGEPAPEEVKQDFRGVDAGYPAGSYLSYCWCL